MTLKTQDLINIREAIQDYLLCVLDGLDDSVLDNVCDVIVDYFGILIQKLESNE